MKTPAVIRSCALAAVLAVLIAVTAFAADTSPAKLTETEAAQIAEEAYVFGYPLVLMDASRQVMTAVAKPGRTRAPANQFNDSQEFPDPTFTAVVSPNADTLYSISWLDLTNGPLILSLPDTGDRYYLMQMLDGWTNVFASPGTRTTGNRKGDYAIVGPSWQGKLPAGVKEIHAPTSMVWVIGRTQTNGPADFPAVRALKKQFKLTPLSAWGTAYVPPAEVPIDPKADAKTPPVEQVENMSAETFFGRLAALMKDNPSAKADGPMVETLARIGVVAGQPFDAAKLGSAAAGIDEGVKLARAKLADDGKSLKAMPLVNGWAIALDMGRYGTKYRHRAVIALVGLGANLPEDAVYPMTGVDGNGKPLSGANKYVLNFAKEQIPPVRAFWSLTMYNAKHFFVANRLDRYAIGDRDRLAFNADGSLTLYVQHASPGKDKESNWLPAPQDDFNMLLRLYWPKSEVLDGDWKPPAVTRVP